MQRSLHRQGNVLLLLPLYGCGLMDTYILCTALVHFLPLLLKSPAVACVADSPRIYSRNARGFPFFYVYTIAAASDWPGRQSRHGASLAFAP